MEIAKSLIETLKKLCLIFEKTGIQFCLIGGLAVSILAKPRATEDIDLLVLIDEQEKKRMSAILNKHLEIIQDYELMRLKKATIWRIVVKDMFNDKGFVIIDLIFADNETYTSSLKNIIPLKIDGVTIPLITPENLIKMKTMSNRLKDVEDIKILTEYNDYNTI